ncbi:unnamed protein product [Arctogadus glacialis]
MEEVRKLSCNEQPALVPSTSPEETLAQQQVDDSPNTSAETHQLPSTPPTQNNTTDSGNPYPAAQTRLPPCSHPVRTLNASISTDCALKPNVFLAHHPTMEPHSLYDQVHIYRNP